ncbi:hypothetical protein CPB84DRAFT_1846478 [Gymnopilus junonius]|uniref:DUF6699 domain-containing protein n=1 Tax=Gymnopilus junonius TaxID=109634 RepID=A0A9P5NS26_GYMJU|nr:hypothetical protein CPB84DRAFT_1846478 [Gymnopilus junonius]
MSGPYVYTPQVDYFSSPYAALSCNQQASPFIPELPLNNSPYRSPYTQAASLPPSPNLPNSPLTTFYPNAPDGYLYAPDPYARRERRGSWNGDTAPETNTPWLRLPRRQRSRSDAGYNPFPGPTNPWQSATPYGPLEELDRLATQPPISRLHIVCDLIPNWPIDMTYNAPPGHSVTPPPITVGDVLSAIYNALQMRISQMDWATLTPEAVQLVSRAYTKRCRAVPTAELMLRNQGVKKIDFLLGKVWFKGLQRVGDVVKLVVA